MKGLAWMVLCFALTACGDDDGAMRSDAATDSGDDDAGSRDSGSDAALSCGPLAGRTADCTECMRDNCCTALATCGADQACVALVQCLRACDEPDAATDCMSECTTEHGISPEYNPVVLCGANHCETECPFASP